MPTIRSIAPHSARRIAESFGTEAERYDRVRPGYPAALIESVLAASPGRDVLDVGCGTGIAARQFHAAGAEVLGVEPDPRMAELARRSGVAVEVATFDGWDPAGRTFDTVVSATAWHWLDPLAGAAKAASVLRPGGALAVFGHVFELPHHQQRAVDVIYRQAAPEIPLPPPGGAVDAYERLYAAAAESMLQTGAFLEPRRQRHEWQRTYTREQWLDLAATHGVLAALAQDERAEVLEQVGAVIGDAVTVSYATVAVIARRGRKAHEPGSPALPC